VIEVEKMRKLNSISKGIMTGLAAIVLGASPGRAQGPYQVDEHTRALWHLDGNANDATGVNNGSPNGSYSWSVGQFDEAILFPVVQYPNGGSVPIPNHPSLNENLNQLTLEAWVYPDSLLTSHSNNIIRKNIGWPGCGNCEQYMLRINENWQVQFTFAASTGGIPHFRVNYPFSNRQWYHIAGTWDGTTAKIWVNRNLIFQSAYQPTSIFSQSTVPLYIGYAGWEDEFFGKIDEVRISDIARDFTDTTSIPERYPAIEISTWGRVKQTFK